MKRFAFYIVLLSIASMVVMIPAHAQRHHVRSKESDSDADESSSNRTKTFTVGKGGSVVVSTGGGTVHITPWSKEEVSVKVTGLDDDDESNTRITQTGTVIHISNHADYGESDAEYDIRVPSQFDVDITTSGGDIHIESGLTGKIYGSTSSGTITLGNLGGTIDMETSGGDAGIGTIKGDLRLRTSGGEIRVGDVSGDADIGTSGGNIDIGSVGKSLHATTAGGDVLAGDIGGIADLSTSGGNVTVGKLGDRTTLSTSGGDIRIAGATGTVSARTAGGGLDLRDIHGSITAKTAGGDIEAELIPSGKGRSLLTTASGDVRIYIPANAKATITARIKIQGWWNGSSDDYKVYSDYERATYDVHGDDNEIRATYVLNGGGEVITLETTNADIHILKLERK